MQEDRERARAYMYGLSLKEKPFASASSAFVSFSLSFPEDSSPGQGPLQLLAAVAALRAPTLLATPSKSKSTSYPQEEDALFDLHSSHDDDDSPSPSQASRDTIYIIPSDIPSIEGESNKLACALEYFNSVQQALVNDSDAQSKFSYLWPLFWSMRQSTQMELRRPNLDEVLQQLSTLLKDKQDLLKGLGDFVPDRLKEKFCCSSPSSYAQEESQRKAYFAVQLNDFFDAQAYATEQERGVRQACSSSSPSPSSALNSLARVASTQVPLPVSWEPPQPEQLARVLGYFSSVQQRFIEEPSTYKEFLAIVAAFKRDEFELAEEQSYIDKVLRQVSVLLRDHADLLLGLIDFLPDRLKEQARTIVGQELEGVRVKLLERARMNIGKELKLAAPCAIPAEETVGKKQAVDPPADRAQTKSRKRARLGPQNSTKVRLEVLFNDEWYPGHVTRVVHSGHWFQFDCDATSTLVPNAEVKTRLRAL